VKVMIHIGVGDVGWCEDCGRWFVGMLTRIRIHHSHSRIQYPMSSFQCPVSTMRIVTPPSPSVRVYRAPDAGL